MKDHIYLDYNASAPAWPEVIEAVRAALLSGGNPSSVHTRGRVARSAIEEARARLARLVNCEAREIIFTSGGTEANNLAIAGIEASAVAVSAIEHDSVLAAAQGSGSPWQSLPVDKYGLLDLEVLEELVAKTRPPLLVAVMLANNETGVIQPIADIARMVHESGGLLHCDAVQAAGKIPVDFVALGADSMSLSGHKIGGPQGVGALVVREGVDIAPRMLGGGQELRRRSGTENMPGIVGFGCAAELARTALEEMARVEGMRDRLEAEIARISPRSRFFSKEVERLPNTSNFTMPGVEGATQVMALDLDRIAVSAGAACASGKIGLPRVQMAMGAPEEVAGASIRVSLGPQTTDGEIDAIVTAWGRLFERSSKHREAVAAD